MVCSKCGVEPNVNDLIITCNSCGRVAHRECTKLNASEFKVIDLKGTRLLRYYCDDCQLGVRLVPKLIAKIDKLQLEVDSLKANIASLSSSLMSILLKAKLPTQMLRPM